MQDKMLRARAGILGRVLTNYANGGNVNLEQLKREFTLQAGVFLNSGEIVKSMNQTKEQPQSMSKQLLSPIAHHKQSKAMHQSDAIESERERQAAHHKMMMDNLEGNDHV